MFSLNISIKEKSCAYVANQINLQFILPPSPPFGVFLALYNVVSTCFNTFLGILALLNGAFYFHVPHELPWSPARTCPFPRSHLRPLLWWRFWKGELTNQRLR